MGILSFLKTIFWPILYFGGIATCLLSIFKEAKWGLLLLIAIVSQPNIYYRLREFPLGESFITILFICVLLGMFTNRKRLERTGNSALLILVVLVSYLALWNSSLRFSLPIPISTDNLLVKDWKNYAQMICTYFLVVNILKEEDQMKALVITMCLVVLFVSVRSYMEFSASSSFFDESRSEGPFWRAGLGSNHFGAFIAHYCSVFLGLVFFDNNKWRKRLYLATILFGLHPLFFSYSRGAYAAAFCTLAFFGIIKKRKLLILVVALFLAWQTILPSSVIERIQMTRNETGELDRSAAMRLELWDHAMSLFENNPVFGVGFGGFGLSLPESRMKDTHNFYLKMMSEQGIIGLALLLLVLIKSAWSGWRLFKIGKTSFLKGLGFGFLGCVVACIVTNMFGDRWSYLTLGTFYWAFWGLVDRGILLSNAATQPSESVSMR